MVKSCGVIVLENKTMRKKALKKSIFPFIMAVITFIFSSWLFYLCRCDPIILRIILMFVFYFPPVLFLSIALEGYFKYYLNFVQKKIIIITIGLIFFSFFYYLFAILFAAFEESSNPITNVKYYKDKVNGSLLKVFPKEIPDDVDGVKFMYAPGVLQAETDIFLYYVDKNMTADEFAKNYKTKAKWIGHIKEYNDIEGLSGGALSDTPNNNEDDYLIYLVEGRCDESGYCNHGEYLLAAFNEKTKEVFYKSAYW